jgi:hypothetical protein
LRVRCRLNCPIEAEWLAIRLQKIWEGHGS